MRRPLTDSLGRFRVFRQSPRNKHTDRKLHRGQLRQHCAPGYWRELAAWSMPNIAKRWIPLFSVVPAILVLTTEIKMQAQAVGIALVSGRVADPIGVAVIGAQEKMTSVATNNVYSAVPRTDGLRSSPSLQIGGYAFEVPAPSSHPDSLKSIILQVQSRRAIGPGFVCRRLQSHKSLDLWAGQERSGSAHHAKSTQGHLLSAVSTCTLTARACRQAARPSSNLC